MTTVHTTDKMITGALADPFPDFEDALQHEAARSVKNITGLVTRDAKGFRHAQLPVFTPNQALDLITPAP